MGLGGGPYDTVPASCESIVRSAFDEIAWLVLHLVCTVAKGVPRTMACSGDEVGGNDDTEASSLARLPASELDRIANRKVGSETCRIWGKWMGMLGWDRGAAASLDISRVRFSGLAQARSPQQEQ